MTADASVRVTVLPEISSESTPRVSSPTVTLKVFTAGKGVSVKSSLKARVNAAPSTDASDSSGGTVSRGVPLPSSEGRLSPTSLMARTRTEYSVPSVSPVMVWLVPVAAASDTSSGVSQLSAASFHCTL